jgi:hypothetical protein
LRGKILKKSKFRLLREEKVIQKDLEVVQLKHLKDEVKKLID